MNWFISDEHYYHSNIISNRFRDKRPFNTVDEMNRFMIKNHNEIVAEGDTVYHLGDFSFAKSWRDTRHILDKLKGTHILILGNHDNFRPFEYMDMGFQSVHTSFKLTRKIMEIPYFEDVTLIHDPAVAGVLTDNKYIHGHVHGLGLRLADNTYNVAVEMHGYYPVPMTKIAFKSAKEVIELEAYVKTLSQTCREQCDKIMEFENANN